MTLPLVYQLVSCMSGKHELEVLINSERVDRSNQQRCDASGLLTGAQPGD